MEQNGNAVSYQLIRSGRKTLALEITRDGRVLVRAPMQTTQAQIESFVAKNRNWIARRLAQVRERAAAAPPEPSVREKKAMAERARARILPRVQYWSVFTGLVPQGITITSARTRYGSCSGKNRLSFSCFLADVPQETLDLVIVHELCHIRVKNHGPAFYALLSRFLPDYQERKKLLRESWL